MMADFRAGNQEAAENLVELFYPELRRMAAARMRGEPAGHTWQPTALVNELYLELLRIKALPPGARDDEQEKAAFLALAAYLMKRLLLHHARPLYRKVEKADVSAAAALAVSGEQGLREIEDVLTGLADIDPVLRMVVEMKVFEGLSREDIAERLGCSVRTVARHWEFAQQWLQEALSEPVK